MTQIVIISGEGERGRISAYRGTDSERAIRARLTRERCGGHCEMCWSLNKLKEEEK